MNNSCKPWREVLQDYSQPLRLHNNKTTVSYGDDRARLVNYGKENSRVRLVTIVSNGEGCDKPSQPERGAEKD